MVGKDEERAAIIDRMLGARTVRDAEAANASADAWLEEHPGDPRILAAQERLDWRDAGIRDPERGTDRVTMVVYACVFLSTALAVFALTGRLHAAGLAGLLATFALPWDGVGEVIAEWRRGPRLSGYENGER